MEKLTAPQRRALEHAKQAREDGRAEHQRFVRLVGLAADLGVSQQTIAATVGLSQQTVSRLVREARAEEASKSDAPA